MTREERHIAVLSRLLECMNVFDSVQPTEERKKAIKAAIQALSQEPTEKPMCDRNICVSNEYNGIGCDECVVNKAEQEPIPTTNNDEPITIIYPTIVCDDAISREAVKELIKSGVSTDTYDDVEQVCKWIDALPSVTQKSGKWIAINEREPEEENNYLVSFDDGFIATVYYAGNDWELWAESGEPIAWMPLPKPYEPQESEEQTDAT